jgi:hypothetical protein
VRPPIDLATTGYRAVDPERRLVYRYDPAWPDEQHAGTFRGDTASVALGPDDTVWVFHRGAPPVLHFDSGGALLRSWGTGEFVKPHGITVDVLGDVYLVDEGAHVVQKRRPDGDLVYELGTHSQPSTAQSGKPFNRPTSVAVASGSGELFVADGYRNSRVHHFDADGRHLRSWGAPGEALGQFSLPHHAHLLDGEVLLVSDRENFRLQFFDRTGSALGQWHCHRPCAAVGATIGDEPMLVVAELGPSGVQRDVRELGNRVVGISADGTERFVIDTFRAGGDERLTAPHDVAVDSAGRIYLAEVGAAWLRYNFDTVPESPPVSLSRWIPGPFPGAASLRAHRES